MQEKSGWDRSSGGYCPGSTTLGLKDLGFGVGVHAGEEVDGVGVAEVSD